MESLVTQIGYITQITSKERKFVSTKHNRSSFIDIFEFALFYHLKTTISLIDTSKSAKHSHFCSNAIRMAIILKSAALLPIITGEFFSQSSE